VADAAVIEETGKFLNSFFKVYASGTNEEIQYFAKNKKIEGLQGALTYRQYQSFNIYATEDPKGYRIDVSAVMIDPDSKAEYIAQSACCRPILSSDPFKNNTP
jgi:hypothetical protein